MSIEETTQYSASMICDVRVTVKPSGLILHAGTVCVGDVTYDIDETAVDLNQFESACTTRVFLVTRKDSNTVSVLVDECAHDGVDRPYAFADAPFNLLHVLAVGVLPPKCKDATQGEWQLFQVKAPPEEPTEATPSAPGSVTPTQLQDLLRNRGTV